jgi:hypothetical protein
MARREFQRWTLGTGATALLCLSLGACALGTGEDAAGSVSSLTFAAQETLPRQAWIAAEAGCEGRLDSAGSFELAMAEGEPGLRVVVLRDVALCVDSASAIAEELSARPLDAAGCAERLDAIALIGNYGTIRTQTALVSGDPSPQPSAPAPGETMDAKPNAGDPSPQPSDRARPTAGDPSPQPSLPMSDPTP